MYYAHDAYAHCTDSCKHLCVFAIECLHLNPLDSRTSYFIQFDSLTLKMKVKNADNLFDN